MKQKTNPKSLLRWMCLITIAPSCAVMAQMDGSHTIKSENPASQPLSFDQWSWDWVNEPWTGNEAPFIRIRKEVDALVKRKQLNAAYLRKVQSQAANKPTDAQIQFRWGYALLRAPDVGLKVQSSRLNTESYGPISQALARPKASHSYEYARLRFLLMTLRFENSELKVVGKRLLIRKPQDIHVKTYLVRYLARSHDANERQLALRYAQDFVGTLPRWTGSYSTLGWVYQGALFLFGDLLAADKGVAAYRRYLQLLPPDAKEERRRGYISIQLLQREKERQQREGFKPPLVAHG